MSKTTIFLDNTPEDIAKGVEAVRALQVAKHGEKKARHGLAELCGAICGELGDYWDADGMVNAFFGISMKKERVAERLMEFAKAVVARGYVSGAHYNYNDLDDNLWAHVEDGETIVELGHNPKYDAPSERKPNGLRDAKFPWTRYTVMHESHGHGYVFFVQENTFTDDGKRHVFSVDLHVRKWSDMPRVFRSITPNRLWEDFVKDHQRGEHFCLTWESRGGEISCDANLWAKNIVPVLQHFDALIQDGFDGA